MKTNLLKLCALVVLTTSACQKNESGDQLSSDAVAAKKISTNASAVTYVSESTL